MLIDNSERLRYALGKVDARSVDELKYPKKAKFWKIFLDPDLAQRMDKVNIVGLKILAEKSRRYRIVIISGTRKEIVMGHIEKITNESKKLNLDFRIDKIYYRGRSREKAPDFKERILRSLLLEDKIVEFHDDNEQVLERIKKYGIKCYLWKNLKPFEY
ncbi:MAG: hypothetical protein Q6363_008570 [Candidatus Njordarchaeota archaeon]